MTTSSFPMYPELKGNLPTMMVIAGRILTHDTAPSVSSGKGFEATKIATGRYGVQLNKPVKIISSVGMLATATGADTKLRKPVWHEDNEGTYLVEFATEDEEGVLENAPSGAEIEFIIIAMLSTSLPD